MSAAAWTGRLSVTQTSPTVKDAGLGLGDEGGGRGKELPVPPESGCDAVVIQQVDGLQKLLHEIPYLAGQLYLEPHPKELMLRNRV